MTEREVTFDIQRHIGVISKNNTGWRKELNIVSWNSGKPKFDIRDWDQDHERMGRGITLIDRDMKKLVELYREYKNRKAFEDAEEEKEARSERRKNTPRPEYLRRESAAEDVCGSEEDECEQDDLDIGDFAQLEEENNGEEAH